MGKYISNIAIIVFLFPILSFNLTTPLECSKVKNGTFYYYSKISRDKVEIERFDSVQLETNTKNGHVLKNKIIWKGDCNYDMYINALSNSKLEQMDSLIATTPASVEIVSVGSAYYVCQWKIKISTKEIEGTDTIYFKIKVNK